MDSTRLDTPGKIDPIPHPYGEDLPCADNKPVAPKKQEAKAVTVQPPRPKPWEKTYVLLPSFEKVKGDKVLYAHASRILHHETNPGCARALMQKHGDRYVWINPPAIPLSTEEMDSVFALPYKRVPHPAYGNARIPAYEMIRFSVNIMRGCFGGCSFCSITEHEGRIIQSRSEDSIINEIEAIRDTVPGFTGVISDLGGPTANMYMLRCKSPRAEQTCRRLSCVYPDICPHMDTNHEPTINLYRRARDLKGIKKILIASGVRYDIAVEDPRYIKELATHHVGGYLKIAPEHTEEGPLSKMMKPGMGSYDRFKELFDTYSKQAGKEQYLIPYFISAHPGTRDEDMVNLALWLKQRRFRLDQVQNFLKDLKTMNLLARDQEISLTSAEKDQIHQLSESYFNSLTSGDLAYMGITEEDVETMYQQYYIANKAVGQLTEEIDLEVSDSDAKVIEVLQIQVSDQEAAQKIYERVTDGNEDFRTVAKEVSEDTEIDRRIGRGEYAAALETAAFELENGQISLVTEYNGNYYIFQCVNDYDVEATQERKTRLYETRKNQAFRQIYSSFQQENKVNFSDEMWSDIHFDANDQTETDNFFTLYQEKFGSQGF